LSDVLVNEFDWDELTADSVWAFGPANTGSNMLIDYSLPDETDKMRLNQVKPAIVQGF
jgi:U5 small nuclear ribonucleoprotein component